MKTTRKDEINQAAVKACRLLYADLGKISPKVFDEEISEESKVALERVIAMLGDRKEKQP